MENKKVKNILIALAFAGIFVSSYLVYYRYSANPYVCNFGKCDIVQMSKYAVFFNVPVAVWGLGYYILLLVLVIKNMQLFSKLWIIWGIAFSLYLTYLELFVIKAICGWCVTSFAIILMIAFLYFMKGKPAHDLSSR